MSMEVIKIPQVENSNDRCVCCYADTGVPKNMPIEKRKYYIVGCGQLCGECYAKINLENSKEERFTEEDLEILLETTSSVNTE